MTWMEHAAQLRDSVVPDWLAEVVRLQRTPVPWAMIERGTPPPRAPTLRADQPLTPVTEAVRSVLTVLGSDRPPTALDDHCSGPS